MCIRDRKKIREFAKVLLDAGFSSPIRKPRGQDILAACGQLKSETKRLKIKKKYTLIGRVC